MTERGPGTIKAKPVINGQRLQLPRNSRPAQVATPCSKGILGNIPSFKFQLSKQTAAKSNSVPVLISKTIFGAHKDALMTKLSHYVFS